MTTKLTLSINSEVIKKARRVASKREVNLSKLVEDYLKNLSCEAGENELTNPVLKALSGSIHVPEKFDYKAALRDDLVKKYIK